MPKCIISTAWGCSLWPTSTLLKDRGVIWFDPCPLSSPSLWFRTPPSQSIWRCCHMRLWQATEAMRVQCRGKHLTHFLLAMWSEELKWKRKSASSVTIPAQEKWIMAVLHTHYGCHHLSICLSVSLWLMFLTWLSFILGDLLVVENKILLAYCRWTRHVKIWGN